MDRRRRSRSKSTTIPSFDSVDDYIGSQPENVRCVLERVRRAIREAVPESEETISYNIPTLKLQGATVLHFAGWSDFVSLYPANARVVAEFEEEIAPYLAAKSTLRFPVAKALPVGLIERIARFRAAEIAERGRA